MNFPTTSPSGSHVSPTASSAGSPPSLNTTPEATQDNSENDLMGADMEATPEYSDLHALARQAIHGLGLLK